MKQTDYKTRVKLFSLDLCGDLTEVRRVTNTINNKSQNSLHRLPWNQYCWCPLPRATAQRARALPAVRRPGV